MLGRAKRRVHPLRGRCTWRRRERDYEAFMQSRRAGSGVVTLALVLAPLGLGAPACGGSQKKEAGSPAVMAMPDPERAAAARAASREDWRDDAVPRAPRAHVDTSACEPAGKSVVVVGHDAAGRPNRWRYFASRHGRRWLTCETADANGDGRVDARYFYDPSGRLVMEQRDLDFDGEAEIVADYSQFKPRKPVVRARNLQ
jgi:hypothetical protein